MDLLCDQTKATGWSAQWLRTTSKGQTEGVRERIAMTREQIEKIRDLQLRIDWLERQIEKADDEKARALDRAAWYRAKLLRFVTTKWIKQERERDGR